jgi:hypothetical protein
MNEKKVRRFAERFSDLLPTRMKIGALEPDKFPSTFSWLRRLLADPIQPQLRTVWREPAPLAKEAGLMMLAGAYMQGCSRQSWSEISATFLPGVLRTLASLGVPPRGADGFLMALVYAFKHVHLLRYCANPDCKEPYFVGKRASQIFCSEPCAAPAQKEAKLKWWNDQGKAWRKARRRAQEKARAKRQRGKHAKAKKA